MSHPIIQAEWFTADELAELRLPGIPRTKRKVNKQAKAERWESRAAAQRGGGREYPVSALPLAARLELVRSGRAADPVEPAPLSAFANDRQRDTAGFRLQVLDAVESYANSVGSCDRAAAIAAAEFGVGKSTILLWRSQVKGLPRAAWIGALVPQYRGGGRKAEVNDEAWLIYRSDWLRPEKPTHMSCYRRLEMWAKPRGIELPHPKTLERKIEREVPREVILAKRSGAEAVRKLLPPQIRTVAELAAMELVNIDGHRWDVFVRFPATATEPERIARPIMVAIQDVYSRKFLARRIGETENAVLTRLCFADLFRQWGIPSATLLDNSRAFASKWITGGATSRFRFKIRADEPLGLLTQLGIRNHWATPYRGQSKPIERGFRDFCDAISRHPAFAGAWTGNKIDAKPENYASKAIDLDVFLRVVDQGIAEHNARTGRRTEAARGRSFDEVFAESYARAAVGKASPEQLRLALLAADRVRAERQTGAITFLGNRYWCEALGKVAGQLLTIRFDPDNLHGEIHAYDAAGMFVATVPVWEAGGFLDSDAARRRAKLEADHRKAVKRQVELEQLLAPAEVAALLPTDIEDAPAPRPSVIRPVRVRGSAAVKIEEAPAGPAPSPFIDRFAGAVSRLRVVG